MALCNDGAAVHSDSELPLHRSTPAELKSRLEAERRGEPFLLFFDEEGRQRILALDALAQARVTVGRGATDVRLDWTATSRACTRSSSTSAAAGPSPTTAGRATARTSTASACVAQRPRRAR